MLNTERLSQRLSQRLSHQCASGEFMRSIPSLPKHSPPFMLCRHHRSCYDQVSTIQRGLESWVERSGHITATAQNIFWRERPKRPKVMPEVP